MGKVMVIGCGGVASVAIHKICQNDGVFTELCIASRTVSKCDALKEKLEGTTKTKITTAQVDADDVEALTALIKKEQPEVVLNLALPYQDLAIMDACLAAGVHYIDTANYEPEDTAKFEYKWQWAYREKYEKAGLTALLGSGFDPGVTSVFSAYALKHYFDEINYIDILDCNAGDHGYPFATNFNPEINIREVSAKGSYWENGHWVETEPMEIKRVYNFPEIGEKDMYLLHHEEIESLALNIPGIRRIRFFMTFGESYLNHLRCLEDVGMTSIEPIMYEGREIVPLQFLKAVLPDPSSLGPRTKGKSEDELYVAAKEIAAPYHLVKQVASLGRLPVVTFVAGGIATPADAAMMMQLGADGVFVGSGIFKSGDPEARAKAIVEATTHFDDPTAVAKASRGLGDAMVGINVADVPAPHRLAERGW